MLDVENGTLANLLTEKQRHDGQQGDLLSHQHRFRIVRAPDAVVLCKEADYKRVGELEEEDVKWFVCTTAM